MLKNILFIRSDRLGEFILSLYAIKSLKVACPTAKIHLLAEANNIELIQGVDFIDYYHIYSSAKFSGYRGAFSLAGLIRKNKIDTVIVLNPRKDFHLASLLGAAKNRVGYNRKWGWCLNIKIKDLKDKAEKHEVYYNMDLIKTLFPKAELVNFDLPTISKEQFKEKFPWINFSKKYIVIHPFSSNTNKQVDKQFWETVFVLLKKFNLNKFALIGSKEDLSKISRPLDKSIEVLVGKFSLRELACFLKNCCLIYIGVDSGPMHLASVFHKPVIAIFKKSNPLRWGPFGCPNIVISDNLKEININSINNFLQKIVQVK